MVSPPRLRFPSPPLSHILLLFAALAPKRPQTYGVTCLNHVGTCCGLNEFKRTIYALKITTPVTTPTMARANVTMTDLLAPWRLTYSDVGK